MEKWTFRVFLFSFGSIEAILVSQLFYPMGITTLTYIVIPLVILTFIPIFIGYALLEFKMISELRGNRSSVPTSLEEEFFRRRYA